MGPLTTFFIRALEIMFSAGIAGSIVVLVLTAIEDVETLFGSDKDELSEGGNRP